MTRVHLSPPWVGREERDALLAAFDSNWIAPVGPHLESFERAAAARCARPHAVALASGTAALHLALVVSGIDRGDDVIVADLTFAATANAVVHAGATPSFVDAEDRTWGLDPALLDEHVHALRTRGRRPRAVIVVDLYGQCADYEAIRDVAARHDLTVIQDAAESLGATYRDAPAGAQGDLACLSFNGNKIVTTSGGGMLLGDDARRIDHARHLASQAREPADHYEHHEIGFNYRLSNLLAALGCAQLDRLDAKLAARAAIDRRYRSGLGDLEGIRFMPVTAHGTPNHWLTVVRIDPETFGCDRSAVMSALAAADIESRPAWKPMHLQKAFDGCLVTGGAVSEAIFGDGLCLPSGDALGHEDQARIIDIVRSCAGTGVRR